MMNPIFFAEPSMFRHWLAQSAALESALLVGYYKVGSGRPSMSWPQSVEEALCFGWIDGVRKRIDELSYQIRFTPRKPDSIWSAVNIALYQRLCDQGRMTPAGELAFSRRREDRSVVYSYEQGETARLSREELRLFRASAAAWRYWETTPPGYRQQMLYRIVSAKRPETRAVRLAKLIEACALEQRL